MNKVLIRTALYYKCGTPDFPVSYNDDMIEIYGIDYLYATGSGDLYEILDKSKFSLFILKHSEYIIKIYE
jgi:hypothetical protein